MGEEAEEHDGAPTPLIVERADGSFLVDGLWVPGQNDRQCHGPSLSALISDTDVSSSLAGRLLEPLSVRLTHSPRAATLSRSGRLLVGAAGSKFMTCFENQPKLSLSMMLSGL